MDKKEAKRLIDQELIKYRDASLELKSYDDTISYITKNRDKLPDSDRLLSGGIKMKAEKAHKKEGVRMAIHSIIDQID